MRRLVVVLGDQLDPDSAALAGFDPAQDRIWMAEVPAESSHVWSHQARIALFLAAMRHHAQSLRERGWPIDYLALDQHDHVDLATALGHSLAQHQPEQVRLLHPGDWRVLQSLRACCETAGVALKLIEDDHFLVDLEDARRWARGRKLWVQEHYYRWVRRRLGILMDGEQPAGGRWNYDSENRQSFGREGPGLRPPVLEFPISAVTAEVLKLVSERFADHPGSLEAFNWPVTPDEARRGLRHFIDHHLAEFGRYQDAMWSDEPFLHHSLLSAALNLKLLRPREVIDAAEAAWREGRAPLAAVEGFIRQIAGWREYVRAVYWLQMPDYLERNALAADRQLPACYWDGRTDYRCLQQAIGQTLQHGYAHHIQRLMVTGLFAMLLGVRPQHVHQWYLAVYVDAVEWVELPNTLGMSQHADGGLMASKPYVASGRYIARMSNYCAHCRYRPDEALGEHACPFTTLYWDFLARHAERFAQHPRAAMQWRQLQRIDPERLRQIRQLAAELRDRLAPIDHGTD
ncbi:MAG: cryptochrome/photolyase family protein [Xanthomonadales bacterium]|nr:cryptochrome/photolyase family protein [Xanthomonadales bacterium]